MKSEWKETPLSDIVMLMIDHRGLTPKKLGGDWSDTGYRALSAKNVKTGKIVQEENIRCVSEIMYHRWMPEEIQRNDILITSEAPFGQIYLWDSDEKIVLSQRLFGVRVSKSVDPAFVYYYMLTDIFQGDMRSRATGTTVIGLRQPELLKCKIAYPELKVQKKISGVLRDIDKKIALNESINENLLQQAQAIFTQEFLMFDKVPDSWQEGSLLDIADYLNGLAMQKFRPKEGEQGLPVLKIKELRQGSCDASSELCSPSIKPEYIVHDGDVIFSWSGSLLVDLWCGGTCGLNQHLFKVTSSTYDKWFYYAWTNHHLDKFAAIAAGMATTMGHIKREELAKAKVLIPSKTDYDRIGGLLAPLYDLVIANRIENRKLAALRDALLPRLISGQIDVSEVSL